MFGRIKRVKSGDKIYEYVQIVDGVREGGKVKQRVIATLGRAEDLCSSGQLDGLVQSLSRFCNSVQVVDAYREGSIKAEWSRSWGPVLVFRRLWEDLGLPTLLRRLVLGRRLKFDIDAAVFALALQRLVAPGSDLFGSHWLKNVLYPPFWKLSLQHLYRALDILARHKETIETALFDARRDLFSVDVQLVFFDTTTLYFEGEGPADLAARGHSKDYRPQSPQVVVCVVTDLEGYPLTCEVFPGNLSDFSTVEKVVALLRKRFAIKQTVLVCDSGMMSAKNLRRIRRAGMDYIIGARMRAVKEIRREVLSRGGRYAAIEDNLRVKEVWVGKSRYVVCHNPEEAERDRLIRERVVQKLEAAIQGGQVKKAVGHSGYARFLQLEKGAASVNYDKVREEAKYDGKFVLRTSTDFPPGLVALSYKSLWVIEALNRTFKDLLETRPVFHKVSRRVQGHIMGSFLSLLLATMLRKRIKPSNAGKKPEILRPEDNLRWAEMLEDLKAFHGIKLELNDTPYLVRTELQGLAHKAFEAAGVRPPPRVQPWTEK